MKAIVIESEYEIDEAVKAFLKDNPDLFESVDEQIACMYRPIEDIGRYVLDADAVVVASTWGNKEQLVDYAKAFVSGKLGKKKFFIDDFVRSLNKWNGKDGEGRYRASYIWDQPFEEVVSIFIELVTKYEVNSIERNYDVKPDDWPEDDLGSVLRKVSKRPPRNHKRILYDQKLDVFYLDGQDPEKTKSEI